MDVDLSADPTFQLDGSKCTQRVGTKPSELCGGTVIAEPVELNEPAILRCRECGDVA